MGEPRRMVITYETPRGIAGAAAGCRRALVARGWRAFESLNAPGGGTPCQVDFTVVKGASVVFVSVADGRGEHAGRTTVTYQAQPILAAELPIADDASEVKLHAPAGRVEYRSYRFRAALAAFYRDAYRSAGYGETTPRRSGDGALIFDGAGTRLAVRITELTTGGRRVAVGPVRSV